MRNGLEGKSETGQEAAVQAGKDNDPGVDGAGSRGTAAGRAGLGTR